MNWLFTFIDLLFYALNLAILARVIVSWLNVSPYNPIVSFIYQITDPILEPLRRIIPPLGMIDISPIIAMLLLSVVQRILLSLIWQVVR
ncbi:MAG TPA: YggT family protein [Anaerolineae bacterium]|nr:YggT family protein [Anaerolineae bacterium]HPL29506.1 YggT family protein [Anaerolineae bacterium]